MIVTQNPDIRTVAIVGVALALVVEGRDARLFGLSLVAFSAGALLIWIEGRLDGLGAAVLVPALTLSWLLAMAVAAAIAFDRWSRPVIARLSRLGVARSLGRSRLAPSRSPLSGFACRCGSHSCPRRA
jgi:hypothetical protein